MGTAFISGSRWVRGALALAAVLTASAALAQNGTAPQTSPGQTLPGLDNFSLPVTRPTPRPIPQPAPTTGPLAIPAPQPLPTAAGVPDPVPSATPPPRAVVPRVSPKARATATAAPVPAAPAPPVAATFAAEPLPTARPTSVTPPPLTPPPAGDEGSGILGWLAIGGAVALAAFGFGLWHRRRRRDDVRTDRAGDSAPVLPVDPPPLPGAAPLPTPPPTPPLASAQRAQIALTLMPKRAGTNLLSASVEYRLGLSNTGAVPATGVRLDIRLLGAGPRQDAILAALFAGPIPQPIVAPFDLPPGATVELDGLAMHPKDTLDLLGEGEPALFVPVMAVNVRYRWGEGEGEGWGGGGADHREGQVARSYAVGLVRGDGAKLQPFRRDGARMHDSVAALEYAVAGMG